MKPLNEAESAAWQEDARKLAAFPVMLAALIEARDSADECRRDTIGTPTEVHFASLWFTMDLAIKKAEGK